MKSYRSLILNREKVSPILISALLSCIILLTFRMKYTNTPYFLFLMWNLFLAGVPFLLSTYLMSLKHFSKLKTGFTFVVWLLFLPNAPYIVTDLYHLRLSVIHLIWLDAVVIFSFAAAGLLLFYFSLCDMYSVLQQLLKKKYVETLIYFSCFLSGFGIYLGRFLRYNSWELVSNPMPLFNDCLSMLLVPKAHTKMWLFTIITGFVLSMGFYSFKILISKK